MCDYRGDPGNKTKQKFNGTHKGEIKQKKDKQIRHGDIGVPLYRILRII